ncbi:type VII toxin-antitoxin system MntA family adenylyltransferase antitoxin [Isoalcanivorax pacificus]|nr:nucleotidyltransferase domain-containing protein [Isoalcanivorax pacificus]
MSPDEAPLQKRLAAIFSDTPGLCFAVLVGSRATGAASSSSDWDVALQWAKPGLDMDTLACEERLRERLAHALECSLESVDLINLSSAGLAMRAAVAEEGVPLYGDAELAWFHFLSRTWRELEQWQWEREHHAA